MAGELDRQQVRALVEEVVEQCAQIIESVTQKRLPEIFRGCFFDEDEAGWVDLSLTEQDLRNSLASLLRRRCQAKDERLFDIELREGSR